MESYTLRPFISRGQLQFECDLDVQRRLRSVPEGIVIGVAIFASAKLFGKMLEDMGADLWNAVKSAFRRLHRSAAEVDGRASEKKDAPLVTSTTLVIALSAGNHTPGIVVKTRILVPPGEISALELSETLSALRPCCRKAIDCIAQARLDGLSSILLEYWPDTHQTTISTSTAAVEVHLRAFGAEFSE